MGRHEPSGFGTNRNGEAEGDCDRWIFPDSSICLRYFRSSSNSLSARGYIAPLGNFAPSTRVISWSKFECSGNAVIFSSEKTSTHSRYCSGKLFAISPPDSSCHIVAIRASLSSCVRKGLDSSSICTNCLIRHFGLIGRQCCLQYCDRHCIVPISQSM